MTVHNIVDASAFKKAVEDTNVMVVDCFATWCGPCKVIAPKLVAFSEEYQQATFFKVDVDEVPDLAKQLDVTAMPTFFIYKAGEKVATIVGANVVALKAAIEKAVET
ncbi:MAG: hypothetical protein M1826_000640 [Phylliscum demangeonii]|nr:MAG: hypothetical protein M1826_000640 [Phylliscum demangeonii]